MCWSLIRNWPDGAITWVGGFAIHGTHHLCLGYVKIIVAAVINNEIFCAAYGTSLTFMTPDTQYTCWSTEHYWRSHSSFAVCAKFQLTLGTTWNCEMHPSTSNQSLQNAKHHLWSYSDRENNWGKYILPVQCRCKTQRQKILWTFQLSSIFSTEA